MANLIIDIGKKQTNDILIFCGKAFQQRTIHAEDGSEIYSEDLSDKVQASMGDILMKKLGEKETGELLKTVFEIQDNTTVEQISDSIKALEEYEDMIRKSGRS